MILAKTIWEELSNRHYFYVKYRAKNCVEGMCLFVMGEGTAIVSIVDCRGILGVCKIGIS